MLINTRGIVLRTVKYGETSLICSIYTEELGLRSYIISGVRTQKARHPAALFQLMALVEMVAYHRDDRELNRIKEVRPAYVFERVPFELARGSVGLFMVELTQKTVKEAEQNLELFEFLFESFVLLDRSLHPVKNFHLSFAVKLAAYLGFLPHGEYSSSTPVFDLQEGQFSPVPPQHLHYLQPPHSAYLDALLKASMEECHTIAMSRQERWQLLERTVEFFRLHVEGMPDLNVHHVLKDIF